VGTLHSLRTNYPTREIGCSVNYDAIKRRAFLDHGVIVVKLDDPRLDSFERQFLQNIGERIVR
jgi:hypothetical protein